MSEKQLNTDLFGNPIIEKSENVYETKNIKDLSDKIETEYVIEISCKDEKEQEKIFNELKDIYLCRVLTL